MEQRDFKLKIPFKPAGDQPQAIEKLTNLIKKGNKNQVLLGVTGSGKTFTMAQLVANLNRPTLVISHNKTLTAQLASEFQEFFPENAVHYFVSYYDYYQPEAYIPRTDTYIEKETNINEEIDRLRNAATQALLSRRDVLIVASVSCIYGLGNPTDYLNMALELSVGDKIKRSKFLRRLTDLQFTRNDLEVKRGTFRVRGDILEIIPSSEELSYKISFWGDEIEKIEVADPLTGRSQYPLPNIKIFPAKHFVAPEEKMTKAFSTIEEELEERLLELKKNNKLLEAQRLEQRTRFDLEMIKQAGFVNGIENYSRHMDGRDSGSPPSTLIDYFPDDFLLFIDESHMTVPQIGGMYEGDRSRKTTLVEHGFRLPSALDNRPLKFDEFREKIDQTIYVSATPGKFELEKTYNETNKAKNCPANYFNEMPLAKISACSEGIVEQLIRPTGLLDPKIIVKPLNGQVDDTLAEIKKRVSKKQRALVTTLTKKTAEQLTDYLSDLGIKVQYLHSEVDTLERLEILRDLRLGKYDVIVGINLLREGLDLPEVSLVCILDADKEGFLRSETSLVQTIGRSARHVEATAIMYADKMTGSMERAILETERRRQKQAAYNKKHGITPLSIQKEIKNTRLSGAKNTEESEGKIRTTDIQKMNKAQIHEYIHELEDQMELAADNLEFEKAAELRDKIDKVKKISKKQKHRI